MTTEARDWNHTRQRIRERWPGLSDEDIEASQGDRTALLALLQGRLGYARPNAEQDLDEVLSGEVIVPDDVADERVHTGTSGPVGPVSGATDYTGGATHRGTNGGRAERPQQPSDESSPYSSPQTPQTGPAGMPNESARPEGMRGTGGPPMGGGGPWDRGHWDANNGPMRSGPPKIVIAIIGLGAVALVGMLIGRRKRKQSKAEQVTEQARHLLEEITERMPSVEELRDKVRSLDELREKKVAAVRR